MDINFHGKKFIFDKSKNMNISNFDWFVDVLQRGVWEQNTIGKFGFHSITVGGKTKTQQDLNI